MQRMPEGDLTADEYIVKYMQGFKQIPHDYIQCLLDLEREASIIAARQGIETDKGSYPSWIWDRVFGD